VNSSLWSITAYTYTIGNSGYSAFLIYEPGVRNFTALDPMQDNGDAPYVFDTLGSVNGTILSDFRVGSVSKAQISSDGQLTLAGTTNQVIFGGTNTPPVSTAAPTKWISVQVQGETAIYRIPLYE
jgi:hypothetical protein